MTVDWDGKIRMDLFLALRDSALIGIKDRFDVAGPATQTTTATAS